MSRYDCKLYINNQLLDENCTVGFDEPMETFFFQSGDEDEDGAPKIWLGTKHKQFKVLDSLAVRCKQLGYDLNIEHEDALELKKYDRPGFFRRLFG